MEKKINRQIHLVRRPENDPVADDFQLVEAAVPEIKEGELLIQTLYLSVDPGMRGMMCDQKSYTPPFALNKPLTGRSIGRVIESRNEDFAVGEIVYERLGWQDYSISDGKHAQIVDPNLAPVSTYLSVLGVPGLCAYFGMNEIALPQAGETVVVSGAAGGVGMIAGQIAKLKGCRVIGIA